MSVPFFDLKRQYEQIKKEMAASFEEVMESQGFILGKKVKALEEAVRSVAKAADAVGVASGSDAILLSLFVLGIGKDDEVVTTPFTFFSTVSSIVRLQARPVFADISEEDFNIDAQDVKKRITEKTRAILPVHLFGQCADMNELNRVGKEIDAPVVEDAAQAIGSLLGDRAAGSMGLLAAFSFYPTKNLGGCGDGGMITTQDPGLGRTIRLLRNHGASPKYFHPLLGVNSRLDEIQAALLLVKMQYLENWTARRRELAGNYRVLFREKGLDQEVILPVEKRGRFHTYHQYVIRTSRRDALKAFLEKHGIGTEIYYPLPLHLQECFKFLGYKKGDFPVAEKMAQEVLALPIFPELTFGEQEKVVSAIGEFFRGA